MADHITEEEQIEALKRWWSDNWLSIVLPIVIALAGYGGWSYWQSYKEQRATEGAAAFQSLLETVEVQPGDELTPERNEAARAEAQAVASEYTDTLYGDFANLLLAKLLHEQGDSEKAEPYLQQVADEGENASVRALAKARLAKLYMDLNQFDQALAQVAQTELDAYKSLYAEIRGDIAMVQGNLEEAYTAYQQALDSLDSSQFSRRGLIDIKLQSARPATAEETTPADAIETEGA